MPDRTRTTDKEQSLLSAFQLPTRRRGLDLRWVFRPQVIQLPKNPSQMSPSNLGFLLISDEVKLTAKNSHHNNSNSLPGALQTLSGLLQISFRTTMDGWPETTIVMGGDSLCVQPSCHFTLRSSRLFLFPLLPLDLWRALSKKASAAIGFI